MLPDVNPVPGPAIDCPSFDTGGNVAADDPLAVRSMGAVNVFEIEGEAEPVVAVDPCVCALVESGLLMLRSEAPSLIVSKGPCPLVASC